MKPRFVFGGAKPQALSVVSALARAGFVPISWVLPEGAPDADVDAVRSLAQTLGIEVRAPGSLPALRRRGSRG